jgi:hypothetical protein
MLDTYFGWIGKLVTMHYDGEHKVTGVLNGFSVEEYPQGNIWTWIVIDGHKMPLGWLELLED